jgi:hypothetical protein
MEEEGRRRLANLFILITYPDSSGERSLSL